MIKQIITLVILLYVFICSVFIEPNALQITKYEIESNQLQGIRAVFLSDFHLKKHDYKRLDKIVRKTNLQNPDIVLLGGDFANGHNYSNMMNMNNVAQKLSLIDAPVFSVLGENDWWSDGKAITQLLNKNGIYVLDNFRLRTTIRGRYIDIIGLADSTAKRPDIERAFRYSSTPRIVISHNPDIYYDITDNVDIILSGHTHGGQFVLPFTKPLFVASRFGSDFASGLIQDTRNKIIISKGLGTSILPIRFNCKPEIIVIDFVKKGASKTPPKKIRKKQDNSKNKN